MYVIFFFSCERNNFLKLLKKSNYGVHTLLLSDKPYKDSANRIKHDLSYANAIQKSIILYIEC